MPDSLLLLVVAVLVVTVIALWLLSRERSSGPTRSSRASRPSRATGSRRATATPSQADQVQAWAARGRALCLLSNESSRPVHDVRAFVALGRRRATFVGWVKTLEPTGDQPAKLALTADAREFWNRWLARHGGADPEVAVEFTFRDCENQYWHRTRNGTLVATDREGAALHLRKRTVTQTLGLAT